MKGQGRVVILGNEAMGRKGRAACKISAPMTLLGCPFRLNGFECYDQTWSITRMKSDRSITVVAQSHRNQLALLEWVVR